MTAKKKKPRAPSAKARLRQKAYDLLCGAGGGYTDVARYFDRPEDEQGPIVCELGLETFGRWLGALQQHLTFTTEEQRAFIAKPIAIDHYDKFDDVIDWLYGSGVRA